MEIRGRPFAGTSEEDRRHTASTPKKRKLMNTTINNYLLAKSTREEIRKVKKAAYAAGKSWNCEPTPFSLESLFPTPSSLLLIDKVAYQLSDREINARVVTETGFSNAQDWKKHNWGVPSDVSNVSVREGDNNYWMVKFTTADCPPAKAIQKLTDRFPKIRFNLKYFGVESSIAGDVNYSYGNASKEIRYEGHSYEKLMNRLHKNDIFTTNENNSITMNNKLHRGDEFSSIFGLDFLFDMGLMPYQQQHPLYIQ